MYLFKNCRSVNHMEKYLNVLNIKVSNNMYSMKRKIYKNTVIAKCRDYGFFPLGLFSTTYTINM